jgi:integrase
MPRRAKGLTAAFVDKVIKPGRYADGGGLNLKVRSAEAKFWVFLFPGPSWSVTSHGKKRRKKREMGGGAATGRNRVSLSQARGWARELHATVRAGRDPLAERDVKKAEADTHAAKTKAGAITFVQVMDLYLAAHEVAWRSPKHRKQWRATLDQYAIPTIGNLPVGSVDTGAVMKIIEPLWHEKTTTASRVRGRIERILDYAKARGWREGENAARWRGHLGNLLPAKSKVQRVEHHAALPWCEIGAFVQRLRGCFSVPSLCLQFLILTATRSSEARGARWSEIDLDRAVWTIPGNRTKAGREHRVALSEAALDVLRTIAQFSTHEFVFPGLRNAAKLSDVALTNALHAAGGNGATVHGMRSTFRDWASEHTTFSREVAEMALAHRTFQSDDGREVGGETELAYRRGDMLEKRRKLMEAWAAFCAKPMVAAEVIPLRAAAE